MLFNLSVFKVAKKVQQDKHKLLYVLNKTEQDLLPYKEYFLINRLIRAIKESKILLQKQAVSAERVFNTKGRLK